MVRQRIFVVLAGLIAALFAVHPASAMSIPGFTHVIELEDADVNLLNVYTKDSGEKKAFVGVVDLSDAPQVNFYAAEDWAKFTAIWDKVRNTPAPADGITAVGGYSDGDHAIWIGVDKDGATAFAITKTANGQPDQDSSWFFLKPEDVERLDKAFARVTDYFAK
ncbi:MAG: hypothetical protein KGJ78_17125 [Alphaproteobacteria bacterium]|nr:hypothetical protein [Alphaproteobacteria bacterium]